MASKKQLSKEDLQWVSDTMNAAPQDHKPSIRWFARHLQVSRPKLIKALGGWKGIARKRPQPVKPIASVIDSTGFPIETFTSDVDKEMRETV